MGKSPLTPEERFWSKVAKTDSCWLWTGALSPKGYGDFYVGPTKYRAHRYAYEITKGAIPEGLTIDHLCRVPHCVNPAHLEAVTDVENILRGSCPAATNARRTHCRHGHPLDGDNLRHVRKKRGVERVCLTCRRAYDRKWKAAKRGAA